MIRKWADCFKPSKLQPDVLPQEMGFNTLVTQIENNGAL
jgi:hypothetical protein